MVNEVTRIPTDSDTAEIIAMAASLFTFALSVILKRKNAASATTGIDSLSGDQPTAMAMDSAPKDTGLSPSPIMEYRLSTSGTPSSAAHSDSSTPAAKARTIKG